MVCSYSLIKKSVVIGMLLLMSIPFVSNAKNNTQHKNNISKTFSSEEELVKDAWSTIQRYLKLDQTGSPYLISCTYKMSGSAYKTSKCFPIQATVKVYYIDYHKEPSSFEKIFVADESVKTDKVIEIVYKPADKAHLSLIEKDPVALYRNLETREISVPTSIIIA